MLVMPALSVESALYVVGGGNNSLTAGLRKGDRIVKVIRRLLQLGFEDVLYVLAELSV